MWKVLKGIKRFKTEEFPEDPEKYADPRLIRAMDTFAILLGSSVHPSPVEGALARVYGSETSRHYAVDRLSTAVDIFCQGSVLRAFLLAISYVPFGGVGVYFNTHYAEKPHVMFHVDIRERPADGPTIWYTDKTGKRHHRSESIHFWRNLMTLIMEEDARLCAGK